MQANENLKETLLWKEVTLLVVFYTGYIDCINRLFDYSINTL